MDEAVSDIRKRIMSVESDITRWQQRQNQNNNFTASIHYDLEQMRSETKEFMDDLMRRDQRMMLALVTLTHLADNLEQLDQDTEALQAIGIPAEFHLYPNLRHGFGLGIGTSAEGWIDGAVRVWEEAR